MDINLARSLVTVAALAAFIGVVWWAYSPSRKDRFERDAMAPFEEENRPPADTPRGAGLRK
ncbi:MAG: cbb3-type cytochrome c oxidase subunit 3 [Burkholderiales bacterium]|nr:cbb3-type cytochrome c oxidase subunit 3 [Burkholderiales bacterium]